MDKNKLKRQIATWVVTFIMVSVFLLDILTLALCNKYEKNYEFHTERFDYAYGDDRIHFLNTANSDCMLLESNGRFALIDSGEGDNNPRRKTAYRGYQKDVLTYIKNVCGDENGNVRLDFILGTHNHYDHIGNFEAIISDSSITIGRAYFKKFDRSVSTELESEDWGNEQTYNAIVSALGKRGVTLISDLPDNEFNFGDFKIRFINTVTPAESKGKGENANSIGVKLVKGSQSAFLAADITKDTGLESAYGEDIGDITLLKIGHHGYYGSSSPDFLKILKPEIAICTNYLGKVYPNVKWNLTITAHVPIYSCVNRNGIIANFTDNDKIVLTQNAMEINNR